MNDQLTIYTIGHSTRSETEFVELLKSRSIARVIDVRTIPRGRTASYGEVARRIGRLGAARAVGGAVGRNPVGLLVPCHRVVAGDGTLGGFGGSWLGSREELLGLKEQLLRHDGVEPPPRSASRH